MNIALINASPKPAFSGSGLLLGEMRKSFSGEDRVTAYELHRNYISEYTAEELLGMDVWVIFSPLYVDALPSHLLSCLMQIESASPKKRVRVYGVINCGFYEGEQTDVAFSILRNFCTRCGFDFYGGLGIGGGGILSINQMLAKQKLNKLGVLIKLRGLSRKVTRGERYPLRYTSVNMPEKVYKLGAEATWRIMNLINGNKPKNIGRKY